MITFLSEPTTAKGIMFYLEFVKPDASHQKEQREINDRATNPYPFIQTELLFVVLVSVEGVEYDVVVHKLGANLRKII